MTIDFLEIMNGVRLAKGNHKTRGARLRAMEMVAFLEGEKHSDRPECACPVITAYIVMNDGMKSRERSRLVGRICARELRPGSPMRAPRP